MTAAIPNTASRTLVATLLATLCNPMAYAQEKRDAQYRVLELTDGRAVTAEILATESTGLLLRTPQGDSLVSFEVLLDMQPTDRAAYGAQTDWVVYAAVEQGLMPSTLELLNAIPGISAHPVGTAVNGVTPEAGAKAAACEGDVACVADAVSGAQWMWVVGSGTSAAGSPQLRGMVSKGGSLTKVALEDQSREQMWTGLHQAIGLKPPSKGPPSASGPATGLPKPAGAFTPEKVTALSFVPLPGTSAMAQKDWGNAGLAWGIALPSAALFVAGSAASQESVDFSNPGFLLSAVGGSYLSIVFANQVTGMRAYQKGVTAKGVGLAPMTVRGGSGAQVVVRR